LYALAALPLPGARIVRAVAHGHVFFDIFTLHRIFSLPRVMHHEDS
jgi:hypothetical protein